MEKKELRLRRIGKNYWGQTAYRDDETGRIYVDLDEAHSDEPTLYTVSPADDPDGEPSFPYDGNYTIVNPRTDREKREEQHEFDYMMCSRISQDIRGYLHGNPWDCRYHNERNIYAGNAKRAMEHLKEHWAKIPADLKPDWLTQEEIDTWEKEIG